MYNVKDLNKLHKLFDGVDKHFNSILPGHLNTLRTWGGGVFYPPPNSLVFYPRIRSINLACRVCLVLSFDFSFKIC